MTIDTTSNRVFALVADEKTNAEANTTLANAAAEIGNRN